MGNERTQTTSTHRLEGMEPDNLLAFLALLGLLRALEAVDVDGDRQRPRLSWSRDEPPLRPVLHLAKPVTKGEVAARAADGVALLAKAHHFDGRKDLNYSESEARALLKGATDDAARAFLLSALLSDAAVKEAKGATAEPLMDPTPLCLLFGQGHQHFLDRLASVPAQPAPPPRGRGRNVVTLTAEDCLAEALFSPWHRTDPTFSFRWDPEEDVRYALMAGNPTDSAYKAGTQHGANRLAAIGLAVLTLAPEVRAGRVRAAIPGGHWDRQGFSLAWPIWHPPASLAAIRSLLGHPGLRKPEQFTVMGIDGCMMARRVSVGKFMNFTRADFIKGKGAGE